MIHLGESLAIFRNKDHLISRRVYRKAGRIRVKPSGWRADESLDSEVSASDCRRRFANLIGSAESMVAKDWLRLVIRVAVACLHRLAQTKMKLRRMLQRENWKIHELHKMYRLTSRSERSGWLVGDLLGDSQVTPKWLLGDSQIIPDSGVQRVTSWMTNTWSSQLQV